MRSYRCVLVVLGLGLAQAEVAAQLIISTTNPYAIGYGARVGSFGLATRIGRARVGLSIGSVGYGYGYPVLYPGYSQTTVIYGPAPLLAYPAFVGPPVVVVAANPAMDFVPSDAQAQMQFRRAAFEAVRVGQDRDDQGNRPRWADRGERAPAPPPRPDQLPPPRKLEPQPEPKPEPKREPKPEPPPQPPPPMPPRPPAPEKNPFDENARLVALGRAAFAQGEYGKAGQRFRQATRVAPEVPEAHFLLAQALFAVGKFTDAADAVMAGMALKPDWPRSGFQPLAMYGGNVADYPEHLRLLEDVVRANPKDPVLLFLYAYQLWFDGRRDEARLLFQRALPGAANPEVIQRFLRALPAAPVI